MRLSGYSQRYCRGIFRKKLRKEWDELQSAATINQLILQQYWNEEKSAKDENPLTEEMKKFIVSYVNSE